MPAPLLKPDTNFGPLLSAVFAYAIGVAPLLGAIATSGWCWAISRRRARRARGAQPDVELREGPATVEGIVEYAGGADHAVRVESITGEDTKVRAAPFYLRRAGGDRLRVEPTDRIELDDEIEHIEELHPQGFKAIYELTRGERARVRGVLQRDVDPEARPRGYRDEPVGWVLRAPAGERMRMSTLPREAPHLAWGRFNRRAVFAMLAAFVGVQLLLVAYHARVLLGETTELPVINRRHYVTHDDDDGHAIHHFELRVRAPWGLVVEDIDGNAWNDISSANQVPVRHVGSRFAQIGPRATLSISSAIATLIAVAVIMILYCAMFSVVRPPRE